MRSRAVTVAAIVQVLAVIAVSCGVPTGDSTFEAIDGDDVPNRLNDPTTTTTTTTMPEVPASTIETTTTTTEPPPPVETVEIYFVSRGTLQSIPRELPPGFGFNQLVALLEEGPPSGPLGVGLISQVDEGLIAGQPMAAGGIIRIDLDPEVFDRIAPRNQRPALAQIVYTFLENTRAVGQVAFTIGGEPFLVPTDSGSKDMASVDDFASLLPGGAPTTTTTTPPSTTTTVPN